MGHQAGPSIGHGRQHMVGQSLGAESGIRRATDVTAAGQRDHVVKGRDAFALNARQAGERGAMRRMGMNDCLRVGAMRVEVVMKTPFG